MENNGDIPFIPMPDGFYHRVPQFPFAGEQAMQAARGGFRGGPRRNYYFNPYYNYNNGYRPAGPNYYRAPFYIPPPPPMEQAPPAPNNEDRGEMQGAVPNYDPQNQQEQHPAGAGAANHPPYGYQNQWFPYQNNFRGRYNYRGRGGYRGSSRYTPLHKQVADLQKEVEELKKEKQEKDLKKDVKDAVQEVLAQRGAHLSSTPIVLPPSYIPPTPYPPFYPPTYPRI